MEAVATIDRRHEPEVGDPAQGAGDLGRFALAEERRVPNVKRLAGNAGVLKELALRWFELVEPGRDRRLDGDGHIARLGAGPRELDDEQRVAGGSSRIGRRVGGHASQQLGRLRVERLEVDLEAVLSRTKVRGSIKKKLR